MIASRKRGKLGGLSDRASDIVLVTLCVIMLLIVAYPLYYILVASFSNPYDVYAGKTFLTPSGFTFDGYKAVFADANILSGYANSIVYTVLGTIFSVAMIYMVAYPLSVAELPGRKALSIFFLITMYFGGGLIPTYLIVKDTGLMGTVWAMFVPGGVAVSNMIIARNFFENSIPGSLKEAAEIDGASKLTIFFRIIIPLSAPSLAAIAMFYGVGNWNSYMDCLLYTNKPELQVLQLYLRQVLLQTSSSSVTFPSEIRESPGASSGCFIPFLPSVSAFGMVILPPMGKSSTLFFP